MQKTTPTTTERLEEISKTSSDIIQKTAEAVGTLKMIDDILEESEYDFDSNMIWALRNAIRNIDSATADALNITERIETFEKI